MTANNQSQTNQSRTIPLTPSVKATDPKQRARILYLTTGRSQHDIALEVGVSERTVFTWIHQYGWNRLRIAALQAPATIIENFTSEIVEMQNAIADRDLGKRFPTNQEADVMRKLVLSIGSMKNTTSLSQNMQMMQCFRDFVRPLDTDFSRQLAHYADKFFSAKSINGYAPYTVQYAADRTATSSPFYDELDGTEAIPIQEPPTITQACTDFHECTAAHCEWPKCKVVVPKAADEATLEANKPWAPLTESEATEAAIRNSYELDDPDNCANVTSPTPLERAGVMPDPAIPQLHPTDTNNELIINNNTSVTPLPETPPLPEVSGRNPAIAPGTVGAAPCVCPTRAGQITPVGTPLPETPSLPEVSGRNPAIPEMSKGDYPAHESRSQLQDNTDFSGHKDVY